MTTPELKPCPFCGGTEIHIGPMDQPSAWGCWVVGCNNYDCPLDVDSVKVEFGTPENAAAAWNTRATDANLAALQAEIERLRALLDRMVVCNPDGSVGIRVTEDALNAAAELYRLFGDAKKGAGND